MDFKQRREELIALTKKELGEAITTDLLIIQLLAANDELTVHINNLSSRLREWHGYFLPEVGAKLSNNEHFTSVVASTDYIRLCEDNNIMDPMGSSDIEQYKLVQEFAQQIMNLFNQKNKNSQSLEQHMSVILPNTTAVAGANIGARLLMEAGSLKNLALMPASTIQLLGAEKALFRHLRGGARSPKHGHIFNHPFIQKSKPNLRGKVARTLGDKLSMCAKLDYFKGDFKGEEYLKEIETKFEVKK